MNSLKLFAASAFLALLLPAQALAVSQLALNPSLQELVLAPGQHSVSYQLTLTNQTNQPVSLRFSTQDFGTLDETGGVAFLSASDTGDFRLARWVTISPDSLNLPPGKDSSVSVKVNDDPSLTPGGHYGAVMAQVINNSENGNVAIQQVLSSLVFLNKKGGERYGLALDRTDRQAHWWQDLKLKLRFHNTGNVHVAPRGNVKLVDPRGKIVAQGFINPESSLILPETYRQYPVNLQTVGRIIWPGRYQLVASYRYDGKDDFDKSITNLYYFSAASIAIFAVLLLGILALGLWWLRKLRRKRA